MDNLFVKLLEAKNMLEKYVTLRKDEKGYFIEWAFKEGAPPNNRCLSKYVTGIGSITGPKEVDEVYALWSFTCNREDDPDPCTPGNPSRKCKAGHAKNWTYDDPGKCACWELGKVSIPDIHFSFTAEELQKFIDDYHFNMF